MFKEWRRKNTLKKNIASHETPGLSRVQRPPVPLPRIQKLRYLLPPRCPSKDSLQSQGKQSKKDWGWPIKRLRPLAFGVRSWHQLCGLSHNEPGGPVKLWFVGFCCSFKVMDWWETKTCYSLLILFSVLCPKGMQNWVPISPWHLPLCLPQYLRSS